jgi:ubiquinone/menaquinone biosynthesis C-methylase UbiE
MRDAVEDREKDFWNGRIRDREGGVEYHYDLVNTPDLKLARLHHFVLGRLGPLEGREVLDLGSGYGAVSCHMARRGARVTALDISEDSLSQSRAWFQKNGVQDRVQTVAASANALPFPEDRFDFIVGSCILHHLDLDKAVPELRRTLKPGGKAVFVENNGMNPVLSFFRNRVLAPLGLRRGSPDESPMDERKIAVLRRTFPSASLHFPELVFLRLGASFFFNDFGPFRRGLMWMDSALWTCLPFTRRWSYFNVIELTREAAGR